MRALELRRSVRRFAVARAASEWRPGAGTRQGPLSLVDADPPIPPGPDWVQIRPLLSGICGSDLATLEARSSRWFEPIVSWPFVPGHEVVALDPDDRRVVVDPVLSCVPRGIDPLCPACAADRPNHCQRLTGGHLPAGLQVGFCAGAGGGWAGLAVAHRSALVAVPDALSDEAAVLIEPVASAVHGALAAPELIASDGGGHPAVVIGAGTLGLATIAAVARLRPDVTDVVAVAKHPHQRALATELGAASVVEPGGLRRAVRRRTGSWLLDNGQLTGGAPLVIDCVGSAESLAEALAVTAPGGTIIMTGMPGHTSVDLTPLWQREITVRGAYTYGPEAGHGGRHTFALAADLVVDAGLERLLSATYPLDRYPEAIDHAANAGRRGAVKVAFDLRSERRR